VRGYAWRERADLVAVRGYAWRERADLVAGDRCGSWGATGARGWSAGHVAPRVC